MRLLAVAGLALLFARPTAGLGAEKGAPTPVPKPPPAANGGLDTQISPESVAAALRPVISDLSPRRVHALGKLIIQGSGFGRDVPGRPLRMRMGGNGFGADLPAQRWTDRLVEVQIPKGVPPGRYYVGVGDARSQWASAIDQTFEVLPDVRDIAVALEITFRCVFDVISAPASIPIRFTSPDGAAVLGRTMLTSAGRAAATFGGEVYRYTGHVGLGLGSSIAVPDSAARFTIDFWGDPPTYWVSRQCADHKRTTAAGAPLPRPLRQSRNVDLSHGEARVTDDTTALSFPTTVLMEVIDSLPIPPPVCPPAGCK